jgi:ankyrin repeat protein
MEQQQQIIQQLQAQLEHAQQRNQELQQQNHHQQQQLQQYQQQESAPPAEEQQVEEQHVEPPAPPPQLPETSDTMERACQKGDTGKVLNLLLKGESPNSVDNDGITPVMFAIMYGNLSVAKVLSGFGADLSIVEFDGLNALHYAARQGNDDAINWVLDNSAIDIN